MRLAVVALLLASVARTSYVSGSWSVTPYSFYTVWNMNAIPVAWLITMVNSTAFEIVGLRTAGAVNEIMCMPTQATRILIAPRACDNSNPALAVNNANCALTPEAALANLKTMIRTWWLPWVAGTEYQWGPPILVGLPQAAFTDANLLQAQGIVLVWGVGDNCAAPASIRIPIQYPTLVVQSSCTDYQSLSYAGAYSPNRYAYNMDLQWRFDKNAGQPYQTLVYSRVGLGITFNIQLNDGEGGPVWLSTAAFTDFVSTPLATNISMTAGGSACWLILGITPSNRTMLPPATLNNINYAQNTMPDPFYETDICGFTVGRFTLLNTWAVPGCCPTCKCGGDVSFSVLADGLWPVPFFVRANPLIPNMTCNEIYPVSGIVPTLGGGTIPRNFEDYLCFFPFINPALAAQSLQEQYTQCQLLGGWVADQGRTVCMRSLGKVECRQGWLPFDQNCYYPPQSYRDAQLAVPGDQAEAACNSIGATSAWTPTANGYLWIEWLMYYWQDCSIPYCVKRPILGTFSGSGSANQICTCYTCTNNGTFTVTSRQAPCQSVAFWGCRASIAANPVPMGQQSMSPLTRSILINGQDGTQFPGAFGRCICPSGFVGNGINPGCFTPTCPLIVNTTTPTPLTDFFDMCVGSGNGYCFEGQPRMCQCNTGWGPPASVDPALPYYVYRDTPCFCPSSANRISPFFVINAVLYNDTANPLTGSVCGSSSQGACSSIGSQGLCICEPIPILNPDSAIASQPEFDGQSCTCPVPLLPPVGQGDRIIAQFCNGIGTCCPFGEQLADQKVYGDPSGFMARCPPKADGCICPSGWTGTACTCPVAPDLAWGLPLNPLNYGFYVDLLQLQPVRYVALSLAPVFIATGCTVLGVSVGASPTIAGLQCTEGVGQYNNTWSCPAAGGSYNGFSRYVIVATAELMPSCEIVVTANNDPPCGPNGNQYAGRAWANEFYRSFVYYKGSQTIAFASAGCTTTACMCNTNFTGDDCTVGVSGVRVNVNGATYQAVCGGDLLDPRGLIQAGSGGSYSSVGATCACQQISAASGSDGTFYGRACECATFNIAGVQTPCAGHGVCIQPSFPYGRCQDDLEDQLADPLNEPFAPVAAAAQVPGSFTFDLRPNGTLGAGEDPRSVVAVAGRSYFLSAGQTLIIPTLTLSFYTCDPFSPRNPLEITYECTDVIEPPQPAWTKVRVFLLTALHPGHASPPLAS